MTSPRIALRKKLYESLAQRSLGKVLASLSKLAKGTAREQLDEIQTNYNTLLTYYVNGTQDPDMDEVMNHLLRQTWELTDDIFVKESVRIFSSNAAFSSVWEVYRFKDEQISLFREYVTGKLGADNAALAVSALTLSALYLFDEPKMHCLIEACSANDDVVHWRALTGLMLVLLAHGNRLDLYSEINNELRLLFDDEQNVIDTQSFMRQFVISHETERIARDLQDNVLPILNQSVGKLHPNQPINEADSNLEDAQDDYIEQWDKMMQETGLHDKMQTLGERKMAGYDINFSSFKMLKSFSFFNEPANWFLPFRETHPDIQAIVSKYNRITPNMLHSIVNNRMMCDSDKYSIFFTIEQMPVDIQENTIMQLSLDGHSELSEMAASQSYINCYLADLYRFFKLNSARNEFTDVFEIPLTLGDIPFFRLINPENSFLPQWADMLVNAQQYQAAISALQKEQEVSDDITDTIFRKLGFCYQKLEDWNNAIDAYTKADIINPDQPWTLSKLAFCQRKAMNFDKAAALYAQLDRQNPDQRRYIEPLALCLCQTKRYADAKRLFEKMDYLWPDAKRTTEYKFCQGLVSWVNGQRPNAIRLWGTIPYNDLVSCFMNYSTPISEQDKQFIIDWFRINKTIS